MSEKIEVVTLTFEQVRLLMREESTNPYFTQDDSPLGKERHCNLVRCGAIPGWKHGRTYFARKADVRAWIETPEAPSASPEENNELPPELRARLPQSRGVNA